jgi:AraC-like DNA-binding protein
MSAAEKVAMYDQIVSHGLPMRLLVTAPTMYVSGIGYSIATLVYLRQHRRRIEASYSNTARVNLTWLIRLAAAAAFIWLMATLLNFTPFGPHIRDEHITLAVALLVYAIGYMGLRQPEVFRYETSEFAVVTAPIARYERSGLGGDEALTLKMSLLEVMERDRPWIDSELTLADLAGRLDSTPHKLSEVLNGEIGQTFYDFVNGYRVREVQRRIATGEARQRKMLALAMDAGFASKSTFNQVFKKHTSQTPSEFEKTTTQSISI